MRTLISLITAAAFLLHLSLGCCAHHAHATESNEDTAHSLAAHTCPHHKHPHDGQSVPAHSGDNSETPRDTCTDGGCVFLAVVKITLATEVAVSWTPAFAFEHIGELASASCVSLETLAKTRPPLPVRLHLFHQQLLL